MRTEEEIRNKLECFKRMSMNDIETKLAGYTENEVKLIIKALAWALGWSSWYGPQDLIITGTPDAVIQGIPTDFKTVK